MLVTEAFTVTGADAVLPPELTVIVADPPAFAVTTPALTVATLVLELDHVPVEVRSLVLPSLYVPVAVYCRVSFAFMLPVEEAVKAMLLRVGVWGGGVVGEELPPPHADRNVRSVSVQRSRTRRVRCRFTVVLKKHQAKQSIRTIFQEKRTQKITDAGYSRI